MQIGWRKLYTYLNRKPSDFLSLGIEYDVNGLRLCVIQAIDGGPRCVLAHSIPYNDWQAELKAFVAEHKLNNTHTVVAFAARKYQMLQVDKPAVPDEELAQALQWSVKDLLMTKEEMLLDYFDIPAQTMGANKVNAVALQKAEVYGVCQGVLEAGLYLETVTIEELATCDLLPDSQDAVATMFQAPGAEVMLNIVKEGKIYFSRRIKGYEQIATYTEMELQMGVAETMSVELQRSMDFFESQLRQAPVKKVLLNLDTEHHGVLCKLIKDAMLVETTTFQPPLTLQEGLAAKDVSLMALGASVSVEEVKTMLTGEQAA